MTAAKFYFPVCLFFHLNYDILAILAVSALKIKNYADTYYLKHFIIHEYTKLPTLLPFASYFPSRQM